MISSLELAVLCGVSQGTVDRALHDRAGISAATKARILAVAREHGYQPNPAARELLSGESNLLGAIVPSVNSIFFMDLMQAVKEAAAARGLRLFMTPVTDREEFLTVLAECAARRFRAVLAVPPAEGIALPPTTRSLPVGTFLNPCTGDNTRLFAPDEHLTGEQAVSYLFNLGHRRIQHLAYQRNATALRDRTAGYLSAMQRRDLPPSICVFTDHAAVWNAISRDQPTAIFCHNDWLALSVMRLLGQHGVRVPEDISVLGVDDSPTFAQLYPELTTLHYPAEAVARQAVAWIMDDIEPAPLPPLPVIERRTVGSLLLGS
ncbi:MAG: LacI family DNA-binding transcriptional regulator [Armatimonadota bacterium]